jgi:hypothetical protein
MIFIVRTHAQQGRCPVCLGDWTMIGYSKNNAIVYNDLTFWEIGQELGGN